MAMGLLNFLMSVQCILTGIYEENQSTIALVGSVQTLQKTKHINVRFHYTQDKILDGTIAIQYCLTALAPEQFALLRDGIMTPRIIANKSSKSVQTTMRRQLTGRPKDGNRQARDQRDINERSDGGETLLLSTPHHHR